MKTKKIIAALIASTMALSLAATSVFAEGLEDSDDVLPEVEVTPEEIIPEVETPVETAPSDTGNSPIALAVIPVALAAAAIVAKKRK